MRLSATARDHWERLAAEYQPAHVLTLREDIQAHVAHIRDRARFNELLPVDIAEMLAERLLQVLADLSKLGDEQQRWLVGAARYFISHEDEVPDTTSVLGLEDDTAVFNHVMDLLGRNDMKVDP